MHYERLRKHGTTDDRQSISLEDRFWSKVDKSAGADACWPYMEGKGTGGYGSFFVAGKKIGAHRIAYELATGDPLGDRHIDHICFNRPCCNPRHLRAVTQQQNNQHRQGAQRTSVSGVRGVRQTDSGRWSAIVNHNRKNFYLGVFDSMEEAAEAARMKRRELFTHSD